MTKNDYPTRSERVRLAKVMEHKAECQVTSRWLQFPQNAQTVGGASFMFVDVMTLNCDDQEKKICQLILTKEDLLDILKRIDVKN
ncbi:hypothetical protein ACO0K9_27850 [Undibacterium sp. Ji50W]|uniref:hypothetical protein n=1 Tax=Undibacterium sp. Ji50W TaxID=3413041 RepID=UPI003BF07674